MRADLEACWYQGLEAWCRLPGVHLQLTEAAGVTGVGAAVVPQVLQWCRHCIAAMAQRGGPGGLGAHLRLRGPSHPTVDEMNSQLVIKVSKKGPMKD